MATETVRPLAPEETARLIDFARACKAAARAVLLYPDGHPAIAATLGRIVQLTSASALPAPMPLTVLGHTVKLHDRVPARADSSLNELASLLHSHLIGELTVHPGGDLDAWRGFLLLLGRAPEDVRGEGGIARLWATMAGRHVQIREIDYAEVLRERAGATAAGWSDVIEHCLRGDGGELDAEARRLLLEAGADAERLSALVAALDVEATAGGESPAARAAALVRLLDQIVKTVAEATPDKVDPVLDNLANSLGQLSPDLMAALLTDSATATETPDVVHTVVSHMTEPTIAQFVGRHALQPGTPVERLATAFQTLVPEDRRERVLSLARDEASRTEDPGSTFDRLWEDIASKLMTSYSDEAYVSAEYGRELSAAKTIAIAVDQLSDDPPERMAAWLGSVSATELRRLDLLLVTDLLRIEQDPERWATLMKPLVALIEDLLLVGDFVPADDLVGRLVGEQLGGGLHRQAASSALDALVHGPLLHHTASHLPSVDDATLARITSMFLSLGDAVVRPLADALTEDEQPPLARERLAAILIAFGASGRSEVERLMGSANAAVRRTAIHLLREFGGHEALPELTRLLNDREQQVQREAVRAILSIGSNDAYRVLADAVSTASASHRDALLTTLTTTRDERAAAVFCDLVDRLDHRGPFSELYLRALQALATLRSGESVDTLRRALTRGEWWAPRRTAVLRDAAATALGRIGTPEAIAALDDAVAHGSRGVRKAARAALAAGPPRREAA